MSGPFSARQVRGTAQRAFNLADAAIEDSKRLEERMKAVEQELARLGLWAQTFSRLPWWRRWRWLLIGR